MIGTAAPPAVRTSPDFEAIDIIAAGGLRTVDAIEAAVNRLADPAVLLWIRLDRILHRNRAYRALSGSFNRHDRLADMIDRRYTAAIEDDMFRHRLLGLGRAAHHIRFIDFGYVRLSGRTVGVIDRLEPLAVISVSRLDQPRLDG